MKRLGIIQSRGLGDIVIALPIAHHYHKQGWEIYWPICREFLPHFEKHVPWVHWLSVTTDPGSFFYDQPMKLLTDLGCDEILPLYQALTNHDFHKELYFQHTKFDQYKYIRASVPFINKWQLRECISRDLGAERELYDRVVTNANYALIHLQGSDHTADFDESIIPPDWQIIYITEDHTPSIFNWLTVIEQASSIVCVDSVFSNLVDQCQIQGDLYFIPRSHIGLTPVLGMDWSWIKF